MTQEILPPEGGAVVQWDPNSDAPLPAYLANAANELGTNIPDRMTVPSLSYEGKVWQIVKDGNKTKLQAQNSDGDMVPIPVMRVVILDFNADRGRAYYPGTYDPSRTDRPKCWSADGRTPDESVQEKQSAACNGCPMAVKGSKVQDSKEMVACSQHRMLALVPLFDIMSDPLRLKIAITSDYDKEIVEHGWFAFRQYGDFLKARGIPHTGLVATKIKFDSQTAYPKLLFALDRLLTEEEIGQTREQLKNPKTAGLLAEKWTAAGSAGTPTDDSDIRPSGLEGAYADGWQAHPDAAGYSYKEQEVLTNEELAARYPAPAPAAPPPSPPPAPKAEAQSSDKTPLDKAREDGWTPHPDAPGYHYKGQEVVADADLEGRYSGNAAAPATPASSPPAATPASGSQTSDSGQTATSTASPSEPVHNPIAAAEADGWVRHPDAEGYHYKGQEVVATSDLAGRYPSLTAGTAALSAAGSPPAASPSSAPSADPATDPALSALLSKWTDSA